MITNMKTTYTLRLDYIQNDATHQITIVYNNEYKILKADDYIQYDAIENNECFRKRVYLNKQKIEAVLYDILTQNNQNSILTNNDEAVLVELLTTLVSNKKGSYSITYNEDDVKKHNVIMLFNSERVVYYMSDYICNEDDEYEESGSNITYKSKHDITNELLRIYLTASLSETDKRMICEFYRRTLTD